MLRGDFCCFFFLGLNLYFVPRKSLGYCVGFLSGVDMASAVEEDVEYDSDPEEAKGLLTMRRREASDDEEGEEEETVKREDRRVGARSDDSDGEGGVADYDEEDNDDDDVEVELEEEDVEEEEYEEAEEEVYEEKGASGVVEGSVVVVKESDGDVRTPPLEDSAEVNSEEKKENEPFAVPTAGAFYMHDDRFRDNAGARRRYLFMILHSIIYTLVESVYYYVYLVLLGLGIL